MPLQSSYTISSLSKHGLYLLCLLWLPAVAAAQLHHDLEVRLDPAQHSLEVVDTLSWSGERSDSLEFGLHAGLSVETTTPGAQLSEIPATARRRPPAIDGDTDPAALPIRRYRVQLSAGNHQLTLRYGGAIHHALQQRGEEYARSFSSTRGIITEQGVFLAGPSTWYPQIDGEMVTFDLRIQLPNDWYGVSQGMRLTRDTPSNRVQEHWRCVSPQEEIYLIAGRFTEYRQAGYGVQAMVFLREADPALAQKYLDATVDYVRLYADLIGPYPYGKFALVENFWETGYGMPSFTLLGPRVIRFPFILHSSYPHEILHNWWGNSVYIDYDSGNWAEGLTSYLADHLIKEQRGQAEGYRRTVLQKYTDYVRQKQDLPLTAFRARHSASSEAVGYGKTLMVFHMLRRQLGDETFIEGLRRLYDQYRFRVADWGAVETIFSAVAQQPLDDFFAQWVERRGAPSLSLTEVEVSEAAEGFRLSALIEQTQEGDSFALQLPVVVQLDGRAQPHRSVLDIDGKRNDISLELPARPLQVDVDPQFDVFRRLHRNEIPPAISQAMGAERVLIVLPSAAPPDLHSAYRALAESWQSGHDDKVEIVDDSALGRLPEDRSVWLFGWRNRFRGRMNTALADYAFGAKADRVQIDETSLQQDKHAVVVLGRQAANPAHALGWLAADRMAALPGLGRKLPHYGRYSYLAFSGDEPANVLKGQWPVIDSPMSVRLVRDKTGAAASPAIALPPRQPLVPAAEVFSATRMQRDIAVLADPGLAGRGLGAPQLERAAAYIAEQFRAAGLRPGGDSEDSYFQTWQITQDDTEEPLALKNVIATLPGTDPQRAGESLVVGAHYDHLGRGERGAHAGDEGRIHPGADDNASGVAVMLELARALAGKPRPRTIVFVAFTGEEQGRLGSRHYVQHSGDYPVSKSIAMLNLDTVGRLGERPLTVFGTGTAREWVHIFRGAGYVTGVPIREVADDFGSSDQTSFIAAGVPAVQLFSGVHPDYHRPGDTVDKIDASGLVKTAKVVNEAVGYLAERPQALHALIEGEQEAISAAEEPAPARRVSLGTVPDYAYGGDGVRLTDVQPDTPAARAGLRREDVIVAVNGEPVNNLRDYAQALRTLSPGEEIRIRLRRNGKEQTVITQVVQR